jgi:hypothetical protein
MHLRVLAALLAGLVAAQSRADERIDCPADSFVEVTTLTALPDAVREQLTHDGRGIAIDVSDRGGPFNPTDVGGGPYRRFAVAAMGTAHVLVAMENGGMASHIDAMSFQLGAVGWIGERVAFLRTVPATAKDLLAAVCR